MQAGTAMGQGQGGGSGQATASSEVLGFGYRDNGKEHGNYCGILRSCRDNGKEHGNYSIIQV